MSRQVLITGGSSYVGQHCIEAAVRGGFKVRATLRDLSQMPSYRDGLKLTSTQRNSVEWFCADLLKPASWHESCEGMDCLLHVASPFPDKEPADPLPLINEATQGTLNVLKSGYLAGIKRMVVISSVAAVYYGYPHDVCNIRIFNEADWTNLESDRLTAYIKSKTHAEKAAWEWAKQHDDVELVVLNPGLVLGPVRNKRLSTSVTVISRLLSGEVPFCPNIAWPIVDVRDLARICIEALTSPDAIGKRIILANRTISFLEIAQILGEHLPEYRRKLPKRNAFDALVKLMSVFDSSLKAVANEVGSVKQVSNQLLSDVFDWQPHPIEATVVDTARSLG